ncbi:hypothetical protein OG533_32295 [Streptomyces sp. NBC_01186]|uniref:hypothetical protein n=1 Tax=Streptomyces sp. NBC_01186 TaxID=2903765 RepID=UPI002E1509B2|nr:hypothetical protein OG533_32295 [Streptomyces sp. NBC_01186]
MTAAPHGPAGAVGAVGASSASAPHGTLDAYGAYTRLVLETMPRESRIGLTLGFVRTFGIPDIAHVLHGTGRMTSEPRSRAKATGAAMFTLIGQGLDSEEGRRTVQHLRKVHERPGITPELLDYVLACFTVCPLRFIDSHGHRSATHDERAAAYPSTGTCRRRWASRLPGTAS